MILIYGTRKTFVCVYVCALSTIYYVCTFCVLFYWLLRDELCMDVCV